MQVRSSYSLHPFHEHEIHQCSMSNFCCWGWHDRRDDRTFALSDHNSDQNNCRDLSTDHHTDSWNCQCLDLQMKMRSRTCESDEKMNCSRISIDHRFLFLNVCPTLWITSPLLRIVFYLRRLTSRTVISFSIRYPFINTRGFYTVTSVVDHFMIHSWNSKSLWLQQSQWERREILFFFCFTTVSISYSSR